MAAAMPLSRTIEAQSPVARQISDLVPSVTTRQSAEQYQRIKTNVWDPVHYIVQQAQMQGPAFDVDSLNARVPYSYANDNVVAVEVAAFEGQNGKPVFPFYCRY